jgi:hypothetical protein
MLEAHPDWIMLTNAVTVKINKGASAIRMLADPTLDLGAVGLMPNDTLYLIGHAGPDSAGDYNPQTLAEALRDKNLSRGHRAVVLPSSCEVAQDTGSGTFLNRFLLEMSKLEYNKITVTGAVGLAISGWGVDQVVNPSQTDSYLEREQQAIDENEDFIDQAKIIAAGIDQNSTSHQIMTAGNRIAMLTEYFLRKPRTEGDIPSGLDGAGNRHQDGGAGNVPASSGR